MENMAVRAIVVDRVVVIVAREAAAGTQANYRGRPVPRFDYDVSLVVGCANGVAQRVAEITAGAESIFARVGRLDSSSEEFRRVEKIGEIEQASRECRIKSHWE